MGSRPQIVVEFSSALFDELTPASDTLNAANVIGELYLKPPLNRVCVRVFFEEKADDHSLHILQPAVNNRNIERY
jgi:hypothetical protein